MADSRNKGASFERKIAGMLHDETGITFRRNLKQYQQRDCSDLTPDDAAWPFSMELKAYASGTDCRPAWEAQAKTAAANEGRLPVVIWKFDRSPIRCRIWVDALNAAGGSFAADLGSFDIGLPQLCALAREIMARRSKEQKPGSIQPDQGLLSRCAPASTEQQQQSEVAKEQTL